MKQPRDGENDRGRSLDVEVVGGPYDGHKATGFTGVAQLPTELVWLVCEDAFRLLDGERGRPSGSMSSIAVYELAVHHGTPRYRFAGAFPVKMLTNSISRV